MNNSLGKAFKERNLWECRSSSLSTVFLSFTLCVGLQRLHLPSIVFACFWMFSLLVAAQLMLNNGSISNRLWKWWRVNLHKLFFARWIVFFSLVKFHCFKRLWSRTKAAAFVNLWKKRGGFLKMCLLGNGALKIYWKRVFPNFLDTKKRIHKRGKLSAKHKDD